MTLCPIEETLYLVCAAILCIGWLDLVLLEKGPFCRTSSSVRLCWELEEPNGSKGSLFAGFIVMPRHITMLTLLALVHSGGVLCLHTPNAPSGVWTRGMAWKTAFARSTTMERGGLGWQQLKMGLRGSAGPEMPQGERDESVQKWRRRELGRIVQLALPALSIPLADPIMSLVDSVCIGRYASTLDLAALGPNLVIFNFVSFSFSFLVTPTPCTLHPTPCTLHPAPCTLHPTPYTLRHTHTPNRKLHPPNCFSGPDVSVQLPLFGMLAG